MDIPQMSSDIMRIDDFHKDDEIVFRGRRASRIPIIIVNDYSILRGEFDKRSYDSVIDDNESDTSVGANSKEKGSGSSSPTSIYSLVASSEGGVPVSIGDARPDSLSASYRQLVSPMYSSKASTIEGTTSSGCSGSDNGCASTRSVAKLADMCHPDTFAAHSMTWRDSSHSQQGDTRNKDRKSQENHTDGDFQGRVLLHIVEDYFGVPASRQVGLTLRERIQTWVIDAAAGLDAIPHYAIIDPETLESALDQ